MGDHLRRDVILFEGDQGLAPQVFAGQPVEAGILEQARALFRLAVHPVGQERHPPGAAFSKQNLQIGVAHQGAAIGNVRNRPCQ